VLARQLPVAGQELARRELAADDTIAELARDLLAHRLRIPGGQMEEQRWCITVHTRYIRFAGEEVSPRGIRPACRAPGRDAAGDPIPGGPRKEQT
jgi:hypothetical protein